MVRVFPMVSCFSLALCRSLQPRHRCVSIVPGLKRMDSDTWHCKPTGAIWHGIFPHLAIGHWGQFFWLLACAACDVLSMPLEVMFLIKPRPWLFGLHFWLSRRADSYGLWVLSMGSVTWLEHNDEWWHCYRNFDMIMYSIEHHWISDSHNCSCFCVLLPPAAKTCFYMEMTIPFFMLVISSAFAWKLGTPIPMEDPHFPYGHSGHMVNSIRVYPHHDAQGKVKGERAEGAKQTTWCLEPWWPWWRWAMTIFPTPSRSHHLALLSRLCWFLLYFGIFECAKFGRGCGLPPPDRTALCGWCLLQQHGVLPTLRHQPHPEADRGHRAKTWWFSLNSHIHRLGLRQSLGVDLYLCKWINE